MYEIFQMFSKLTGVNSKYMYLLKSIYNEVQRCMRDHEQKVTADVLFNSYLPLPNNSYLPILKFFLCKLLPETHLAINKFN